MSNEKIVDLDAYRKERARKLCGCCAVVEGHLAAECPLADPARLWEYLSRNLKIWHDSCAGHALWPDGSPTKH